MTTIEDRTIDTTESQDPKDLAPEDTDAEDKADTIPPVAAKDHVNGSSGSGKPRRGRKNEGLLPMSAVPAHERVSYADTIRSRGKDFLVEIEEAIAEHQQEIDAHQKAIDEIESVRAEFGRGAPAREKVAPAPAPRRARKARVAKPGVPRGVKPEKAKTKASGRLPRRSAEEIAETLSKVVALVNGKKEGLRAEQIREALGLAAKEMPRVLKEGLATKALKSRGQKRSTTYFIKA